MREVKTYLSGHREGPAPQAYVEYILMTQLWHCPPSTFEQQPEDQIDLHIRIYSEELRARRKEEKRAKQSAL